MRQAKAETAGSLSGARQGSVEGFQPAPPLSPSSEAKPSRGGRRKGSEAHSKESLHSNTSSCVTSVAPSPHNSKKTSRAASQTSEHSGDLPRLQPAQQELTWPAAPGRGGGGGGGGMGPPPPLAEVGSPLSPRAGGSGRNTRSCSSSSSQGGGRGGGAGFGAAAAGAAAAGAAAPAARRGQGRGERVRRLAGWLEGRLRATGPDAEGYADALFDLGFDDAKALVEDVEESDLVKVKMKTSHRRRLWRFLGEQRRQQSAAPPNQITPLSLDISGSGSERGGGGGGGGPVAAERRGTPAHIPTIQCARARLECVDAQGAKTVYYLEPLPDPRAAAAARWEANAAAASPDARSPRRAGPGSGGGRGGSSGQATPKTSHSGRRAFPSPADPSPGLHSTLGRHGSTQEPNVSELDGFATVEMGAGSVVGSFEAPEEADGFGFGGAGDGDDGGPADGGDMTLPAALLGVGLGGGFSLADPLPDPADAHRITSGTPSPVPDHQGGSPGGRLDDLGETHQVGGGGGGGWGGFLDTSRDGGGKGGKGPAVARVRASALRAGSDDVTPKAGAGRKMVYPGGAGGAPAGSLGGEAQQEGGEAQQEGGEGGGKKDRLISDLTEASFDQAALARAMEGQGQGQGRTLAELELTQTQDSLGPMDEGFLLPADPSAWDVGATLQWLRQFEPLRARKYAEEFRAQRVDGPSLLAIYSEFDCKCLGVTFAPHQRLLLAEIGRVRDQQARLTRSRSPSGGGGGGAGGGGGGGGGASPMEVHEEELPPLALDSPETPRPGAGGPSGAFTPLGSGGVKRRGSRETLVIETEEDEGGVIEEELPDPAEASWDQGGGGGGGGGGPGTPIEMRGTAELGTAAAFTPKTLAKKASAGTVRRMRASVDAARARIPAAGPEGGGGAAPAPARLWGEEVGPAPGSRRKAAMRFNEAVWEGQQQQQQQARTRRQGPPARASQPALPGAGGGAGGGGGGGGAASARAAGGAATAMEVRVDRGAPGSDIKRPRSVNEVGGGGGGAGGGGARAGPMNTAPADGAQRKGSGFRKGSAEPQHPAVNMARALSVATLEDPMVPESARGLETGRDSEAGLDLRHLGVSPAPAPASSRGRPKPSAQSLSPLPRDSEVTVADYDPRRDYSSCGPSGVEGGLAALLVDEPDGRIGARPPPPAAAAAAAAANAQQPPPFPPALDLPGSGSSPSTDNSAPNSAGRRRRRQGGGGGGAVAPPSTDSPGVGGVPQGLDMLLEMPDDDDPMADQPDLEKSYEFSQGGTLRIGQFAIRKSGLERKTSNLSAEHMRLKSITEDDYDGEELPGGLGGTGSNSLSPEGPMAPAPRVALRSSLKGGAKAGGGGGGGRRYSTGDSIILLEELGRGAGGQVYKAIFVPTMTLVAVKEVYVDDAQKRQAMLGELGALHNMSKADFQFTDTLGGGGGAGGAGGGAGGLLGGSGSGSTDLEGSTLSASVHPPGPGGGGALSAEDRLAQTVAAIQDRKGSPHIVAFYDAYTEPARGSVMLVLEYMNAGTLEDLVKAKVPVDEHMLATVAESVLRGLRELHAKHQIHRDIKPSNILLDRDGNVKISDFGIAREVASDLASTQVGTFQYMSPERIQAQPYSFNSDIWSLGLVVATLALGKMPLPAKYWELVTAVTERAPPELPRGLFSEELRAFVAACLSKDADRRPGAARLLDHPFLLSNRDRVKPKITLPLTEGQIKRLKTLLRKVLEFQMKQILGKDWETILCNSNGLDSSFKFPRIKKRYFRRLAHDYGVEFEVLKTAYQKETIRFYRDIQQMSGAHKDANRKKGKP